MTKIRGILFLLLVSGLFGAGCRNHVTFGLTNVGQSFRQGTTSFTNQLDILWVVDNSGSMSPLQTNLTNNFQAAVSEFQAKGWDFKMAVTTSDAYKADPALNGYQSGNSGMAKFSDGIGPHTGVFVVTPQTPNLNSVFVTNATTGSNGSGDERVFSSFRTAMNSNLNAGFLRSNSFFAVIILSDEDDFSDNTRCEGCGNDHDYNDPNLDSVQSYVNYLDGLTTSTGAFRRYNVSSIAVLDSACQQAHLPGAPSTIIGQRYIQLTQATNGVLGSVCDASFASSLLAIAQQIEVLSTQFFLSGDPNPSTFQVFVNKVLVPNDPNNGFTYNSAANSILFHGSSIPPQGADIQVFFIPNQVNH